MVRVKWAGRLADMVCKGDRDGERHWERTL
jgi:hypothetical protein